MTNFKSIAGGTLWMLMAACLVFGALSPVSLENGAQMEMASARTAAAHA